LTPSRRRRQDAGQRGRRTSDITPEADAAEKKNAVSKDRWVNNSIRSRWIDVVIYATAGAFSFELLLTLGVRLFSKAPSAGDYQPWFVLAVGVLGVIVMAFIVADGCKPSVGPGT